MGFWRLIHKRYEVCSAHILCEVFYEDAQKAYGVGSVLCPFSILLCLCQ